MCAQKEDLRARMGLFAPHARGRGLLWSFTVGERRETATSSMSPAAIRTSWPLPVCVADGQRQQTNRDVEAVGEERRLRRAAVGPKTLEHGEAVARRGARSGGERILDRVGHAQPAAGVERQVHRLLDLGLTGHELNLETGRQLKLGPQQLSTVFAGQTTIVGGGSRNAAAPPPRTYPVAEKNLAHRIVDVGRLYLSMLDKMGVPQKMFGDATQPLSEV
mgnify:CR=1 FL=1